MSQIKRSLAIRPTYVRQISNESRIEMASPLSTVPPPSVMDEFERNPVRGNTLPTPAPARGWALPRPVRNAAEVVSQVAANTRPYWRDGAVGVCLAAMTAWLIALTVKLGQANAEIDGLYNIPFCDEIGVTPGKGILPVKMP